MSSSPPLCGPDAIVSGSCCEGDVTDGMLGMVGNATGIGGGGGGDREGEEALTTAVGAISTGIFSSERNFFRSKSFPLGSSPVLFNYLSELIISISIEK